MSILNTAECADYGGNTGVDCFFTPALIRSGFLVPSDFELDAADLASEATVLAALEAASLETAAKRIYPLPGFDAITDGSADPTIATLGYGGSYPVRDGDNDWTFPYTKGGICLNNQLQKFNGGDYKGLFIDDQGTLIGTKNADGTGMKGVPLNYFYAYPWKANDGSTPTSFRIRFVFQPKYINKFVAFATGETVSYQDVAGIQNAVLAAASRTTATIVVTAKKSCGGKDLHDIYSSELANVARWVVTNTVTGNAVTITSVTSNGIGWALLLDSTDTDYNTTAGGMKISFAAPSVLDAAGISKYESNVILSPAV